MYRYKNETDQDLTIVGVGVVKPGEEFKSRRLIESVNLTILDRSTPGSVIGTEAPQPGAVTEAERVGDVPNQPNQEIE